MENPFKALTKDELQIINEDRLKAKNEGMRPRSFDKFIKEVQEFYPLTFGEGWKYTEELFFEEVLERFFKE